MNELQKEMFKSIVPFFLKLEDGITFSELIGVHSQKVKATKILEEYGLINRKVDKEDARKNLIMLTKRGKALQVMLEAAFLEMNKENKNIRKLKEAVKCQKKTRKTKR